MVAQLGEYEKHSVIGAHFCTKHEALLAGLIVGGDFGGDRLAAGFECHGGELGGCAGRKGCGAKGERQRCHHGDELTD